MEKLSRNKEAQKYFGNTLEAFQHQFQWPENASVDDGIFNYQFLNKQRQRFIFAAKYKGDGEYTIGMQVANRFGKEVAIERKEFACSVNDISSGQVWYSESFREVFVKAEKAALQQNSKSVSNEREWER